MRCVVYIRLKTQWQLKQLSVTRCRLKTTSSIKQKLSQILHDQQYLKILEILAGKTFHGEAFLL